MDTDTCSKFIGSLTKFLQSLCNGYVDFHKGVELVGHIYLNIDTGEKVNYFLHEKVSKNDEDSVTFISNSFHAKPHVDKDNVTAKNQNKEHRNVEPHSKDTMDSDDDDVVIMEDDACGGKDVRTDSQNEIKRNALSSSVRRLNRRLVGHDVSNSSLYEDSNNMLIVSQSTSQQDELLPNVLTLDSHANESNVIGGDMKLEQISADDLLSLASQVDDGTSNVDPGRKVSIQVTRSSFTGNADHPIWVKQEPPDDFKGHHTDWSHSPNDNGGSSNCESYMYPSMMHQNQDAFPTNPVFPSFTATHGSSSMPFPGMRIAPNSEVQYGNVLPGTSTDFDPSVLWRCRIQQENKSDRKLTTWQRVMQDPERHERYKAALRERMRRLRSQRHRAHLNRTRGMEM